MCTLTKDEIVSNCVFCFQWNTRRRDEFASPVVEAWPVAGGNIARQTARGAKIEKNPVRSSCICRRKGKQTNWNFFAWFWYSGWSSDGTNWWVWSMQCLCNVLGRPQQKTRTVRDVSQGRCHKPWLVVMLVTHPLAPGWLKRPTLYAVPFVGGNKTASLSRCKMEWGLWQNMTFHSLPQMEWHVWGGSELNMFCAAPIPSLTAPFRLYLLLFCCDICQKLNVLFSDIFKMLCSLWLLMWHPLCSVRGDSPWQLITTKLAIDRVAWVKVSSLDVKGCLFRRQPAGNTS